MSSTDGFTKVPNWIFSEVLPVASPSAYKVIQVIVRETVGWRREWFKLSFADFIRIGGFKSRASVSSGIKEALKHGWIIRRKEGQNWMYRLRQTSSKIELVDKQTSSKIEPKQFKNRTSTSSKIEPEVVQKLNRLPLDLKKGKKDKEREERKTTTPPPATDDILIALCEVTQMHLGKVSSNIRNKLIDAADTLREHGHTAQQVVDGFGLDADNYWHSASFGKDGQLPALGNVLNEIDRAIAYTPVHKVDVDAAWALCLRAVAGNKAAVQELKANDAAFQAFKAVGGRGAFRQTTENGQSFLKNRFSEVLNGQAKHVSATA